MPDSKQGPPSADATQQLLKKIKSAIVITITILALLYLMLRPVFRQMGWNFPWDDQQVAADADTNADADNDTDKVKDDGKSAGKSGDSKTKSGTKKSADSKRGGSSESTGSGKSNKSQNSTGKKVGSGNASSRGPPAAKPGDLVEISPDVFKSTNGLIYGPGSKEGHRLKHVMQHASDNPNKPIHGVFDGDQEEILKLIDLAYAKVKQNSRDVSNSPSGNRNAYTVDMKKRVGFVGGKTGKKRNHPPCYKISLVLEGDRVVTAYPR